MNGDLGSSFALRFCVVGMLIKESISDCACAGDGRRGNWSSARRFHSFNHKSNKKKNSVSVSESREDCVT